MTEDHITSSAGQPLPPDGHVPKMPFMTIKNRYGFNPERFWERCVVCGFKSAWHETGKRHYPKCNQKGKS